MNLRRDRPSTYAAHVEGDECEGSRGHSDLVERHRLGRAVGQHRVARAVLHGGDAAEAGEEAEIAAVRSALDVQRAMVTADGVRALDAFDEVALRGKASGCELAAPPLDLRGVGA